MININDEIVLDIKRLGINGEGIGYYNRLAVFVAGAIPGEKALVKINSVSEKMAFGEIKELLEVSDKRVEASCEYYDKCQGCQMMHIEYDYACVLKRQLVTEAIIRYTKLNPRSFEIKKTTFSKPFGYRNKSALPVRKLNDQSVVGIINPDNNHITYINNCLVQNPLVNEINNKVLSLIDKLHISTYHERYKRGVVKFIVTRVSSFNNEAQVTIICNEKNSKIFTLAKELINIPEVVSVYEDFNPGKGMFSENLKLLEGKEDITEKIGHNRYNLKPNAFFQLNPTLAELLYEEVKKACRLSFKEVVLDAFCGVGSIGIYLAKYAKEVIGIEYNKDAVINARSNAKINNIENISFYDGDIKDVLPNLLKTGIIFDIIIVNPPRSGLTEEFKEQLMEIKANKLVYVSCNPSTLAKDLNVLSEIYNVKYIHPFDMFPMTSLVETVACLSLKDK